MRLGNKELNQLIICDGNDQVLAVISDKEIIKKDETHVIEDVKRASIPQRFEFTDGGVEINGNTIRHVRGYEIKTSADSGCTTILLEFDVDEICLKTLGNGCPIPNEKGGK